MKSLFSDDHRALLHVRINRLSRDSRRQWGRMTSSQMVCHLTDSIESAFDTEDEPPGTGALSRQPLKWLVINVLPWPRGKMESPPRLQRRQPTTWDTDVAALHAMMDRLAARAPEGPWPPSDVFGRLTRAEWGALLFTHADHHLKQFGV